MQKELYNQVHKLWDSASAKLSYFEQAVSWEILVSELHLRRWKELHVAPRLRRWNVPHLTRQAELETQQQAEDIEDYLWQKRTRHS